MTEKQPKPKCSFRFEHLTSEEDFLYFTGLLKSFEAEFQTIQFELEKSNFQTKEVNFANNRGRKAEISLREK
mgnify:CR=1 FL=1